LWSVRAAEDPLWAAWRIMCGIVGRNAHGVHTDLNPWFGQAPDEPEVVQTHDCLLSVIYWHIRETLVRGNVEVCRECGTPFVQRDGRQRFCPPPSWTGASQCAMRFRKREQRKRARGEQPTR
jgi:hypothetical protein